MKPTHETPTEPRHYAAISAAWAVGATSLAIAARRRGTGGAGARDLPVVGLATFALARTISREKAESWLREPFLEESADGQSPRGEGMRYAVGELLACTRCTGTWAALGVTGLWTLAPGPGRVVAGALAAAGANDLLQAAHAALAARAD